MSIRILVVDDNPDILANVRDFLAMKDGWTPEAAATGLEALERLERATPSTTGSKASRAELTTT